VHIHSTCFANTQRHLVREVFSCYAQEWLKKVLEKLPEDQKDEFKAKSQPAIKFLIGMIKELQL
jgi:hypothetical protein